MSDSFPRPEKKGWMTVRTDQLRFPRVCSDCGCGTDAYMGIRVGGMERGAFLLMFVGICVAREMTVCVPVCGKCPESGQRTGVRRGMGIGFIISLGWVAYLAFAYPAAWLLLPVFPVIGIIFGRIFGKLIGYRIPVQLKRYRPSASTIMIRFDRPAFERMYLQNLGVPLSAPNSTAGWGS